MSHWSEGGAVGAFRQARTPSLLAHTARGKLLCKFAKQVLRFASIQQRLLLLHLLDWSVSITESIGCRAGKVMKQRIVFAVAMSCVLSFLMSAWVTFVNVGLINGFVYRWLSAWLLAWPAAGIISFTLGPSVQAWSHEWAAKYLSAPAWQRDESPQKEESVDSFP